jgi:hypothetical protein
MRTLRAALLGTKLRELREIAQVKPQEACAMLGWSERKLYRIESGETVIKYADLIAAMDLYGADSETRGGLDKLRDEARTGRRGWWVAYGDVFRSSLPALEHTAARIRTLETAFVPGLLQTPDYARAVMSVALPEESPEKIDRRVQARMARQTLLAQRNPPALHVIIDEAVLARRVGGEEVMLGQISALWLASRRPNITIRLLPFDAGAHVGMDGAFTIWNFDETAIPEAAFTEGPGGDVYLEGAADLARLSLRWDRLATAALPPEDSAERFAELTRE